MHAHVPSVIQSLIAYLIYVCLSLEVSGDIGCHWITHTPNVANLQQNSEEKNIFALIFNTPKQSVFALLCHISTAFNSFDIQSFCICIMFYTHICYNSHIVDSSVTVFVL